MTVFTDVKKEDLEVLLKKGYSEDRIKTIHESTRLTKGKLTMILYNSGKLLLQGSLELTEKTAQMLTKFGIGKEVKPIRFKKQTGWMIGSDETLKGDTFGGLVVAAVKADDNMRKQLIELGVADSKKLKDKEIIVMAETIKKIAQCEIKSLLPQEYNSNGKVTVMLNKLHKQCADYLKPGKHVVDKYPGCRVGDIAEEKAESKYVEVAAASILARAAGLKQLDYLSSQAGFAIPRGSTHVKLALHELKERGFDFKYFVKTSFKNVG